MKPWISSRLYVTFVCIIVQEMRESWNQNIVFDSCTEYLTLLQSVKHEHSAVLNASIIAFENEKLWSKKS
jgi:hypothetical protein